MNSSLKLSLIVGVAAVLTIGYYSFGHKSVPIAGVQSETTAATKQGKVLYYRDPMSPATSPVPKKSDMGMDYVPVYESDTQGERGTVQLSPERIQQLGVQTDMAMRRDLVQTVHAVGILQMDETRQTVIAPRFEGWIEKLSVNATGLRVKKGDALFTLYSPELTNIEAECRFTHTQSTEESPDAKNRITGTIKKLQTLGVPQDEIDRLWREHTVNYHIVYRAPADGTVMKKEAVEGMKFMPGDTLYHLADLSHVWVMVDVYEQDLVRIAAGQTARIMINAFPGKVFEGKVAFIYPDINPDTRTTKVRIDLPNPTGELRLDMYADVEISGTKQSNVLTVPASAVLNSGERQVVLLDLGNGRFRPQAVSIGARGDGYMEILSGLNEHDQVVISANFLIDSESNLRAALQGFSGEKQ